ncbi:MAG: acyl-CoA desaturase [Planctomycetota bacterium]|nr:MAG: acyl-CoA desaturase [Planctomycetota bacterium]
MKIPHALVSVWRWFDNQAADITVDDNEPLTTDWVRIIPFLAMHAMCLGVIWVGWSPVAVGVAIALYWVRMFAITGFYHRYFSHRTFKTSRFWQFMFGLLGCTATQKGPLWWAAHHRHHHRHSDDPEDVHSPHTHGLWWSHMGWITSRKMFPTNYKAVPDLAKFPELVFVNRFDLLIPVLFAASIFLFGVALNFFWPQLGTSGSQMLIWGFFISTVVLFHCTCTINSLAHLIGRRRFATKDESRNSLFLAIITMGEGWHNNHHHYPGAVRQGFYWWEIDMTYYILRGMEKLGIIWDLNKVPETALNLKRLDNPASLTDDSDGARETSDHRAGESSGSLVDALPRLPAVRPT